MKASHQMPLRCIENRQIFQDNSSEYFSVISCSSPYMISTNTATFVPMILGKSPLVRGNACHITLQCFFFFKQKE